jgi:hypothetical protein
VSQVGGTVSVNFVGMKICPSIDEEVAEPHISSESTDDSSAIETPSVSSDEEQAP